MSRLATVAPPSTPTIECLVRIAAVHLEIPDLPSAAARDPMAAEDLLIRPHARDEGSVDTEKLESGAASAHRHATQFRLVRADWRHR